MGPFPCVMTFTSVFWAFHPFLGERGNLGGPWVGKMPSPRVGSVQFSSVAHSCLTLHNPMDCSTPGLPVHHQLPELAQIHICGVGDAIQPSHPLSSSSPPAFSLSQHQGLFKWVNSLHQVAKVLEFQLQHQSFQWIFRTISFRLLLLLLSRFSRVQLCATPETATHQAPLSLGLSRQEHWSGLLFPSPVHESEKWKWRHSVVSDCSLPHGLQPTRLRHPWDFPGKSTGVGCHCLLQIAIARTSKIMLNESGESDFCLISDKKNCF